MIILLFVTVKLILFLNILQMIIFLRKLRIYLQENYSMLGI